ncbi:hypothetical protein [Arcticibacterium luteifluviistationis]|uniref:Uncharacterized protein n=1 Tax=Arcticibacterium luteifluviistationis TaxID=1784714 RepID=A0A2Z4G6W8_9BACT|nr:hypothetical protein [Arcticibacterium luteifluviistationis]AWV96899.1 hypothetical protein DJ013_01370 [Arcticibacterium luteifluviistationis]
MVKQVTLREANELLKAGKILRMLGPDLITIRKLGAECYVFHNDNQRVAFVMDGAKTVNILNQNTFYFEG